MIDPIDPKKVESLASQGLTTKQIADCLGIGRTTFYEHQKKDPNIQDALKRGRSKGVATVANALFQAAKEGNITAQIFYLKNRAPDEWKDRKDSHITGKLDHRKADAEPVSESDRWIAQALAGKEASEDSETLPH